MRCQEKSLEQKESEELTCQCHTAWPQQVLFFYWLPEKASEKREE
jgi:hypothetical protein